MITCLDFSIEGLNKVIRNSKGTLKKLDLKLQVSDTQVLEDSEVVFSNLIPDLKWGDMQNLEEFGLQFCLPANCSSHSQKPRESKDSNPVEEVFKIRPKLPGLSSCALYIFVIIEDEQLGEMFDLDKFEGSLPSAKELAVFMLTIGGLHCRYSPYVKARTTSTDTPDPDDIGLADQAVKHWLRRAVNEMFSLEQQYGSRIGNLKVFW